MKKFWILSCMLLAITMVNANLSHVWAAEEEGGGKAEAKPEAKGEGGGEGGEGEKGKKAPDGISGGRFAGDPVYVHVAPMVMPIITDNGVEQLVTMQIDIQVKDFDTADKLKTQMPRVVDSIMRALYGGLGQGSLRRGKLVDITKIKAKATTAVEEIIGADGVKEVLILGVSQHML